MQIIPSSTAGAGSFCSSVRPQVLATSKDCCGTYRANALTHYSPFICSFSSKTSSSKRMWQHRHAPTCPKDLPWKPWCRNSLVAGDCYSRSFSPLTTNFGHGQVCSALGLSNRAVDGGCFGLNNSDLNKPLEKHASSQAAHRWRRTRLLFQLGPAGELSPGLGYHQHSFLPRSASQQTCRSKQVCVLV